MLAVPVTIGLRYLNTTYLPNVIKTKIIQQASEKLDIDIQIKGIEFDIFKGVVLKDVNIASNKDPAASLQIERLSATFLILPIFNQKKIIFPSISIYNPKFDIIRSQGNKFNFQQFIPTNLQQEIGSLPYSLLVYKVDVFDAQIDLWDKKIQPGIKQTLKLDSSGVQIYPWGIDFKMSGKIINGSQTNTLNLSGTFKYETNELKVSTQMDKLDILPYLVYSKNLPIDIKMLLLNDLESEITIKDKVLSIAAEADMTNGHLVSHTKLVKDETLITDASAKIKAIFVSNLENVSKSTYAFYIDKVKAKLIYPRIPDKVNIMYAKLNILPDKVEILNSLVNTLKTTFLIKGKLENFSNLIFDIKLQSEIDLPTAKDFARTYFDFINPFIVEGKANLSLNLVKQGSENDLEFTGAVELDNANLKTLFSPYELNAVKGTINFQRDKIDWSNISFILLNKLFYSKASISNLSSPLINLELYSDKLNLRTKLISKQNNSFDIEYLNSSYANSKIDLSGTLEIEDSDNYYVDFDIDSLLELQDLKQIEFLPQAHLSKINPKGKCKINGVIKGNIKNPEKLNSILNINSDELNAYGLKFDDLKMQIAQENQQIKIPQSDCKFYNGTVSLNGLIDLEKETFPCAAKILAENVDLSKLKTDMHIKDDKLKGTISSTAILSGPINSLQDLKAQGEFLIQDGYLWGFNPLKKLGDFLFIPKYDTLVFREASGNFGILDKSFILENVVLSSDIILLSCEGTIDFAGNLDLDITPKQVTDVTENLDEFEKFYAGIFSESGGLATVKITGTIQNPKFEKKIIALQVIDKVKDQVVDKVKAFTDLIFGTSEKSP